MKSIDIRRENDENRGDRAQRLHAFDEIAACDLLNKLLEKAKGELFGHEVGHEKRASFRFSNAVQPLSQHCFYFGLRKIAGKLFPERNVCWLGQVKDFSRQYPLSDEARFFFERELSGILTLHETRKH